LSGIHEELLSLPSPSYSDQILPVIIRIHPGLEEIRSILRPLINGRTVSENVELKNDDRVAIVPPIAGGNADVKLSNRSSQQSAI
jgi:hypothetical protein